MNLLALFCIGLSLAGKLMIEAPKYLYSITSDNKVQVWECWDWQVFCDGRWATFKSQQLTLTHEEFLHYFVAREELCNLHTLGELSKHWTPPKNVIPAPPPAPPTVPPQTAVVYYVKSKNSWIYHLPSCRYANPLMQRIEADEADKYQPCKACKPNELMSIIKEFLPNGIE